MAYLTIKMKSESRDALLERLADVDMDYTPLGQGKLALEQAEKDRPVDSPYRHNTPE